MNKLKLGILLSYICVASGSAAIVTPALPHIAHDFSLSKSSVTWVVSIFLLGYVFGQLIYAPVANSFGRIKALRMGMFINLMGVMLCLVAIHFDSYIGLLFGRLVTALGAAAGLSCTFMLINELLSPEQAKQAIAYALIFFTVGIALSVTLGGLITQFLVWPDIFWFLLLHAVLMLILTGLFDETLMASQSIHLKSIVVRYLCVLRSKQLVIYSLIVGFNSSIAYCYSAAAPLYAHSVLRLSAAGYAYWSLVNVVGMLLSGVVSARLMRLISTRGVIVVAYGFIFVCLLSLFLLDGMQGLCPVWFFLTTSCLYFFSGIVFPAASYVASNAVEDKASGSSMMSFINMGFAMLSVIFMGYFPLPVLSAFIVIIFAIYIFSATLL